MNFLAHCALAWDAAAVWQCHNEQRSGLLAGGILGDFVKGRVDSSWPTELQAGVRLHRKVDALSNRDPHTRACSNLFAPELRRLAPIFVDLLGDYHLANHWSEFYAIDLHQFTQECYACLGRYEAYLTEPGQRFYEYALDVDLLAQYQSWSAVERGLGSVLRRLQRTDLSSSAASACHRLAPDMEQDVLMLYQNLQRALHSWNAFNAEPQSS